MGMDVVARGLRLREPVDRSDTTASDALGGRAADRHLPGLREGPQHGRVRLRPGLGHGRDAGGHSVLPEARRRRADDADHRRRRSAVHDAIPEAVGSRCRRPGGAATARRPS